MKVNRTVLLACLETVEPGLSSREIVEQSSCFVFTEDRVMTFNGEIACAHECEFDIQGAIQAGPLLAILRKLQEEEVEITLRDSELRVKGKRREASIRREQEVVLPVEDVEKPTKWKKLHTEFTDAIRIVRQCAGKDQSNYALACVHIHPKWVEAMDNDQVSRYELKTGTRQPMLVRSESIKHIEPLGMTEFSESDNWIHFRNPAGLVLSCRRSLDDYHDVSSVLETSGSPVVLPKGLADAADKASIFSAEDKENNEVQVELLPGKVRLSGEGVSGWYRESKKVSYKGEPIAFRISPTLLQEILKKSTDCEITDTALRVNGGKFVYITSLGTPKD